jgi:hypothetical protein
MICTHAIWLNHHLWRGKNCTAVDTQHIPLFKHVKRILRLVGGFNPSEKYES